jgi:dolichol-phosphate mannosyltransferase
MLSIIIPTYNERDNIKPLLSRLCLVLNSVSIKSEVIVVDDNSPDKTGESAQMFAEKINLKLIKRIDKRGLSSAILDGFQASSGDSILVMDADLSHPPELIPEMLASIQNHDIVIASRYVKGGNIEGWSLIRKLTSNIGRLLTMPLTHIKDPLSGYFLLRREVIDGKEFSPRGFKLLFDILLKSKTKRIKEIPYTFCPRKMGNSKMNIAVVLNYMLQILAQYIHKIKI